MGVSKKGRRKIVRNDRIFYWCVKPDYDSEALLHLSIVSDDKKFVVSYHLNQIAHENPFIVVMGKEFKGLKNLGHCWERFMVPEWESEAVTPFLVSEIIDWCFTLGEVTPVDCNGNILPCGRIV